MDPLDLILHPVRIRMLRAFSGDRTCTTADLRAVLPDVSQATIYRHVRLLTEAGVLQVADSQQVRGAVERSYRLNRSLAAIDQETASKMTPDDHRRAFASGMAALVADFGTYLAKDGADPAADLVAYRQIPLWLTDQELKQLVDQVQSAISPTMANEPDGERRRYLLSPILFPLDPLDDA